MHRANGSLQDPEHFAVGEKFARIKRQIDGLECDDYRLSTLASSLITLNGDTYRPQVLPHKHTSSPSEK